MAIVSDEQIIKTLRQYNPWWRVPAAVREYSKPQKRLAYFEALKILLHKSIRRFTDADISVAVALPAGLITPIVRSANRKSISDISNEIHSLVTRAKACTLKP